MRAAAIELVELRRSEARIKRSLIPCIVISGYLLQSDVLMYYNFGLFRTWLPANTCCKHSAIPAAKIPAASNRSDDPASISHVLFYTSATKNFAKFFFSKKCREISLLPLRLLHMTCTSACAGRHLGEFGLFISNPRLGEACRIFIVFETNIMIAY
jgi:hypothetical protein